MYRLLKKTLSVCIIGFGLGILFVILLPFTGWLFIMGVRTGNSWYSMFIKLKIHNKGVNLNDSSC